MTPKIDIIISVKLNLEPRDHTLLDAIHWIAERALKRAINQEIAERRKLQLLTTLGRPTIWITVREDYDCRLVREIHGHSSFGGGAEEIDGEIKVGGSEREFEFIAKLDEISTPKGRFSYEGVIIEITEVKPPLPPDDYKPIVTPKRFFIRGLESKEFKLVKTEKIKRGKK